MPTWRIKNHLLISSHPAACDEGPGLVLRPVNMASSDRSQRTSRSPLSHQFHGHVFEPFPRRRCEPRHDSQMEGANGERKWGAVEGRPVPFKIHVISREWEARRVAGSSGQRCKSGWPVSSYWAGKDKLVPLEWEHTARASRSPLKISLWNFLIWTLSSLCS